MKRPSSTGRRASVGVTMIIILVIMQLLIVAIVMAGGRDQDMTLKRMDSLRAFYAAEGGMNLALREVVVGTDIDGDGTMGSISNDGNAANDPVIGSGAVYVTAATASDVTTLTSYGSSGIARRKIQSTYGATSARNSDGKELASPGDLAVAGTLTTITSLVKGPPPKLLRYAFYSDSSGTPGALLAQSATAAIASNSALYWHSLSLPSTTLAAGTYWVAMGFEHSNEYYSYAGVGTTKINGHDPIGPGFSNPWATTTQTLTRQINMFANVMQDTAGPFTFASDLVYENSNPSIAGAFRDVSAATYVLRGNDTSSGTNTALTFNAGGGTTIANAYTVYVTDPTNATQTDFTGSIRVTADMMFTGGGLKYIGLGALHNEIVGQDGLAVVIRENGGNDRLHVYRLPQNGDLSGSSTLATTNLSTITAGSWYRLIMDITTFNGNVEINGTVHSHTTTTDPNSAINATPLAAVNHSAAMTSLTGLKNYGEVAALFDGTNNSGRGNCTNLIINSNPVAFPTLTNVNSVMGWAEVP